jgi:hypothetical protein
MKFVHFFKIIRIEMNDFTEKYKENIVSRMDEVSKRKMFFLDALKHLENGIKFFNKYKCYDVEEPVNDNEHFFRAIQDAVIFRFKRSNNLFFQVIEDHLKNVEKMSIPMISPRGIIRSAVGVRLLSELEGEMCMDMLELRDKIPDAYQKEVADEITHQISKYYEFMKKIIERA